MRLRRPSLESEELKEAKLNLKEFPLKEEFQFHATHENHWINSLFKDISSKYEVEVTLEVKKLDDHDLKDPFIIKGNLKANYEVECIRCLESIPQTIESSFSACFLDKLFEKQEEYAEQLTIYADHQEHDLYFSEKQLIDIQELINEVLQLNHDHYPLHDENCKGLCQFCGINLNEKVCQCSQAVH